MEISEKAAYVKGLFDGLELDPSDKQTKVLKALIELVNELAEEVAVLEQSYDDVCDQIDALDEDLSGVEDILSDGIEDFKSDGMCDCDFCSPDAYDDEAAYEVVCPTCGKVIPLTLSMLEEGGIKCPECGETLEFDYDEDELDQETDADEEESSDGE